MNVCGTCGCDIVCGNCGCPPKTRREAEAPSEERLAEIVANHEQGERIFDDSHRVHVDRRDLLKLVCHQRAELANLQQDLDDARHQLEAQNGANEELREQIAKWASSDFGATPEDCYRAGFRAGMEQALAMAMRERAARNNTAEGDLYDGDTGTISIVDKEKL